MKPDSQKDIPKNWQWRDNPIDGGRAVVFDIDGVLSNAEERQSLIAGPKADWKAFFEACGNDETIPGPCRLLDLLSPDVARILVSGRPLQVREETLDWLDRKKLPWDLLIVRDRGEYSDSKQFKQQTVRRLRVMGFDIALALEDDPLIKEMFEEEDIPCMYVHSGYYNERAEEKRANK